MNVPARRATMPPVSAAVTPRQQMQQILIHLSGRVGLLGQPDEVRNQLVMITGALIQACDASQVVSDAVLEHLLLRTVDAGDIRQAITPLLAACVTADQRVFEEFIDLLTTALMLERSSLGARAQRIRYDTDPGEISAAAQLRPMLERADQVARSHSLPEPAVRDNPSRTRALGREDPATISFWEALDPAEREALRSVASWRTFAAGAQLMHEGERADHVIVILGGRVKVCVDENGSERVLAVRGLGDLVGERAALQVSVRSATVIALEMVGALVVQTRDFAAFITEHPRVLDIVQGQLHDRLNQGPARHGPSSGAVPTAGKSAVGRSFAAGYAGQDAPPLSGENCTVLLTDVVAFGARTRGDEDRRLIREALFRMTHTALQDIPSAWSEDRGDGLLMVVPPSVPTARVMDQLLSELPAELARHNRTHRESARFRLRVAVNVGPVVSDSMGVSGEAIIVTSRLAGAPGFKEAIANSGANLGVIASAFVYETVIRHSRDPAELAGYSQVNFRVKESRIRAWMWLLSHSA